ncbi:MAG: sporulation protein YqfD [Clostridia bacterium]|nr:sporulation protein YqfD [Clostridia bacterium]
MRLKRVRFTVRGLNLERLMNEAGKRKIRFMRVAKKGNRTAEITCTEKDWRTLSALARKKGYETGEARPVGWLRWLRFLGARWGLLAGAVLGAVLTAFSLRFLWRVQIGNAGAYGADVRAFLEEKGIRPGMLRSEVDLSALREEMEWRWPAVQWVRAEWAGVTLRILLDEGVRAPQVETRGENGDVVAAEDGILLRLTVYAGTPAAKAGDLVRAGQVLIRGEERGRDGEAHPVKARGEAVARVWVAARCRMPLWEEKTLPTGKWQGRWVIETPFLSWSPREQPAYLTWDLETETLPLGGAWAPVRLRRETYWEAAAERTSRDAEETKRECAAAAMRLLAEAVSGDETVDKWINFSMIEGDAVRAEAVAEVRRDIGRFVKR